MKKKRTNPALKPRYSFTLKTRKTTNPHAVCSFTSSPSPPIEKTAEKARRTLSAHASAAPPVRPAARVTVSANDSGSGVGRISPSNARTGADAAIAPSMMCGYFNLSQEAKRYCYLTSIFSSGSTGTGGKIQGANTFHGGDSEYRKYRRI